MTFVILRRHHLQFIRKTFLMQIPEKSVKLAVTQDSQPNELQETEAEQYNILHQMLFRPENIFRRYVVKAP